MIWTLPNWFQKVHRTSPQLSARSAISHPRTVRLAKYSYIYIYILVHGGVSGNDPEAAEYLGGGGEAAVVLDEV